MYDVKAQVFSYPIYYETVEAAEQWFNLITNTHGCGPTHTHSDDFVVYHIGEYDVETGRTTYFEERRFFVALSSYRKPCKACGEVVQTEEPVSSKPAYDKLAEVKLTDEAK